MTAEERAQQRIGMIPRSIVDRSLVDPTIHAAIYAWVDTEETVEQLLERTVLLLSASNSLLLDRLWHRMAHTPKL